MFRIVGRNDLGLGEIIDKFVNERWEEMNTGNRDGVVPLSDIFEKDGEVILTLEIPGVAKEDLTIQIEEKVLTIEGEKKETAESEGLRKFRQERKFGHFSRSFSLSDDMSQENIQADVSNGVLTLKIRRIEPPKPEKKFITIT
jgi:HSP20 family protein